MKAYQLKIMIKNSKPPIWRRCIIPAGITFSQLSMILNDVMGWCGYHLFSFDFYHRELEIMEGNDDDFGYSRYDFAEASTTYINEYMESEDWFTYTYDFGDDWQHRVTIEKVITDYEYSYPQVIKYKGDCPLEDCGGIDGYYYQLEVLENPSHSEYEELKEVVGPQLDVRTYDMKEINKILKEYYQVSYGKGETRSQQDLYQAQIDGVVGLRASKAAKNKEKPARSSWHDTSDKMTLMVDWEEASRAFLYPVNPTLTAVLESFTKDDLMDYAGMYELKGISKLKKKELVDKIVATMLDERVMAAWFSCLKDDEIKAFELLANEEEEDDSDFEQELYLMNIYETGYLACLQNGVYLVPEDVKAAYQKINTAEFQQQRKRKSFILACMEIAGALYGVFSFSVLSDMCKHANQNEEGTSQWDEAQIRNDVKAIPAYLNDFIIIDNQIIAMDLYHSGSYHDLLAIQEDKKFYLPTKQEIEEFTAYACFPNDRYLLKLERYLESIVEDEHVKMIGLMIQRMVICGREISEIYEFLQGEFEFASMKQLRGLTDKITDMWNHTRMITNRGYTPMELRHLSGKTLQPESNIININGWKKDKVYPNDSCPCGSGKKYKHCCGKNR